MMTYIIKRILRRPMLCLGGMLLAGVLCLALCYFVRYRNGLKYELEAMEKSYVVRGVVTDARGTKSNNLRLNRRFLEFVQDEKEGLGAFIKEVMFIKNLESLSDLGSGLAVGVSSPKADKRLDKDQKGAYFTEKADFFESKDFCCLVPESVYEKYQGKTIACALTNSYTSAGLGSIGGANGSVFDLEVVGWYKGEGADVFLSFPAIQRLAGRLTNTVSVDAISFELKDNTQSDLVREVAKKEFVTPDPSSTTFRPGLSILDRQYRSAITEMEQNIARTERLLPISLFISLAAGFLMGFLSVRGETKTYALMRTLGMGKGKLVLSVLLEQLLLPLAACLTVGLIMGLPIVALLYFVCYTVGCLAAVIRPALSAPTKLLRVQE